MFAPQNLIRDPPFTKLDLLSCRNLLIYLHPETQQKLTPLFYHSLLPGGILFLGNAESLAGDQRLFAPLDGKSRLFRRKDDGLRMATIGSFASFGDARSGIAEDRLGSSPRVSFQSLADRLLLRRFAPPSLLVNSAGDICYISGRTGSYLEPAAGKVNWNLFAMAREELRFGLAGAFKEALHRDESVTIRGLTVAGDHAIHRIDVTLQRIEEPGPLQGLIMIAFTEMVEMRAAHGHKPGGRRLKRTRRKAEPQYAEVQLTQEEMRDSQEELRSAKEELQSTNEELQSANEELISSQEELQSANEELQALNAVLQGKIDELLQTNRDLKHLLDSAECPTLYLDDQLHVRRFTPQISRIIRLIPSDVGRPISDLATELDYPRLANDVRSALRGLAVRDKMAVARDGRRLRVRVRPCQNEEGRVDGVVITFADFISARSAREHDPAARVRPPLRLQP